ncbi:DUF7009 family protein [Portibacter marinus]|uniref:DUF7009 family protein n=1 Tax=Portibacter marinus TaxID=2898660 RepID=UPI001F3DCCAE|nr:hypothetical protein [Portibacter marinus]
MKIRILNNSIRFRMSRTEMSALENGYEVSSVTHFLKESLMVVVRTVHSESSIDLYKNKITLSLEKDAVISLNADENHISHRFSQGELSVLFEKDFKCLTERAEDESELYPNPLKSH